MTRRITYVVIIPTGSDTARYRAPIVSGTLAASWLAVGLACIAREFLGVGLPVWLSTLTGRSNSFIAIDLASVVYNALGIWFFGSASEGRIGWWRFVLCLLVLAGGAALPSIASSYSARTLLVGSGITPLVTGVLAMAAVWAPADKTHFEWYWFYWREPVEFSISYGSLAVIAVTLTLPFLLLGGSSATPAWAHAMALVTGVALACGMLRTGMTPSEGDDLITYFKRPNPSYQPESERVQNSLDQQDRRLEEESTCQLAEGKQQFRAYLAKGNADAALTLHRKLAEVGDGLRPDAQELRALVGGLHKAGRFADSAPFMAMLIDQDPQVADPVRLKLAQVCVAELERPGRAAELLDAIDLGALNEKQLRLAKKIYSKVAAMQAEGVVELDDGAW